MNSVINSAARNGSFITGHHTNAVRVELAEATAAIIVMFWCGMNREGIYCH